MGVVRPALLVACAAASIAAGAIVASSPGRAAGAATAACPPQPPPLRVRRITRPRWLANTLVTEYFPVPESWFRGRLVRAPGLAERHRVDWLYGPAGVAMNGEGIGLDGRLYHFAGPWSIGWVNAAGKPTTGCWNGVWSAGKPAWLALGWRNAGGGVTFPLAAGGWSNGRGVRTVAPAERPRFGPGPSLPLAYWRRVAVDPRLIPLGSRVFIRAYCPTPAHGWFTAGDTGGAIIARHVDVYRAPPPSLADAHALWHQRIYVVPPGARPLSRPSCR
jgi:hypothetical protein